MPKETREERYVREAMESSTPGTPPESAPTGATPEDATPVSPPTDATPPAETPATTPAPEVEIAEPSSEDFISAVNVLRASNDGAALRVADYLEAGRQQSQAQQG